MHLPIYHTLLISVSACSHKLQDHTAHLYFLIKLQSVALAPCRTLLVFQRATWTHSAWGQTGAIHFLGTGRHEHTSSIYKLVLERTVFSNEAEKIRQELEKATAGEVFTYLQMWLLCVAGRKRWTVMFQNFVGKKHKMDLSHGSLDRHP